MSTREFKLADDQSYIQLNNLLKTLQLAQTGGHAKILIQNGEVLVNGEVEFRVRKKLYKADSVEFDQHIIQIT